MIFGPVLSPVFFAPLRPVAAPLPAPVPAIKVKTVTLGGKAITLGGKPISAP